MQKKFKFEFLASGCSSVASHGRGGGGGGVVPGDVWGQHWGGGQQRGGGKRGVSSTFKNRPSHHKYKSPKQFELKLKQS